MIFLAIVGAVFLFFVTILILKIVCYYIYNSIDYKYQKKIDRLADFLDRMINKIF